jgi:hypothetical protein
MYIFAHFIPELVQRIVSGQGAMQSSITALGEKMFTNTLATVGRGVAGKYSKSYSVKESSYRGYEGLRSKIKKKKP